MDFFQAQDFFKQMYPNKQITFQFDESCHRFHEIVYTDGSPNLIHHVENHKVKVTVEGMDPVYVPILPHRENFGWAKIKEMVNAKTDVCIHDDILRNLCKLHDENDPSLNNCIEEVCQLSGLDASKIQEKMNIVRVK